MNFETMTLSQLVTAIAIIGALSGAFYKVFSLIADVKYNKESIKRLSISSWPIYYLIIYSFDSII